MPPLQLKEQFERIGEGLCELGESPKDSNSLVGRTLDLLMPQLISGEVDVSELDIAIADGG